MRMLGLEQLHDELQDGFVVVDGQHYQRQRVLAVGRLELARAFGAR